jgi:hypothetical protein
MSKSFLKKVQKKHLDMWMRLYFVVMTDMFWPLTGQSSGWWEQECKYIAVFVFLFWSQARGRAGELREHVGEYLVEKLDPYNQNASVGLF